MLSVLLSAGVRPSQVPLTRAAHGQSIGQYTATQTTGAGAPHRVQIWSLQPAVVRAEYFDGESVPPETGGSDYALASAVGIAGDTMDAPPNVHARGGGCVFAARWSALIRPSLTQT